MTPTDLLRPLLTYCTDLPGFSRHAIEVAETEQRIGTMLSTLHHWERSAVEWRERAEGLHARVAELERERRELVRAANIRTDELHRVAGLLGCGAEGALIDERITELQHMAECAAIMAVCGYFSRMRGPDAYAWMNGHCAIWEVEIRKICHESLGLNRVPLYAGSAPVPAAQAEAKVADGWVLVPREPTEEMVIAALKEVDPLRELIDWTDGHGFMREDARRAWSAMLAAMLAAKAKGGGA